MDGSVALRHRVGRPPSPETKPKPVNIPCSRIVRPLPIQQRLKHHRGDKLQSPPSLPQHLLPRHHEPPLSLQRSQIPLL